MPVAHVVPASTGRITPVIQRASSEAKNLMAAPTSQPLPSVPRRLRDLRASRSFPSMPASPPYTIGVYTMPVEKRVRCELFKKQGKKGWKKSGHAPGQTQLTRIRWVAWLAAIARVMLTTAPLLVG